ncbi:MAG: hypothetical protein ACRDVG_08845 [Jatrophihabitantaceae bacterium]
MTAVLNQAPAGAPLWNSMPGWGIVGDLTPPELINARKMHVLRRIIVIALGLVIVLCGVGYGYGVVQHSGAADELSSASAQTTELQLTTHHYSGITRIETIVSDTKGQVASAMQNDVDVARLVAKVRGALPGTMSIASMSVTLAGTTAGSVSSAGSSSSLDRSGNLPIGTITLTGSAQNLDDLPSFVDALSALRGISDVVPTSNQASGKVVQFAVSLTLTNALYSHHFNVTGKGVK